MTDSIYLQHVGTSYIWNLTLILLFRNDQLQLLLSQESFESKVYEKDTCRSLCHNKQGSYVNDT